MDLYKEEDVIWRASNPKHKIRNEVNDAWKRLEIGMGHAFTIGELKRKKDSLMASFRTCLSKVKSSRKSGADEVYRPIWYAYPKIASFLLKDVPKSTSSSEVSSIFTNIYLFKK